MGRKRLGKSGKSFASFPVEVYDLGDSAEKSPSALKKIESQVRQPSKYDHEEMRRADAARLLAYYRILGLKWLSSLCHYLDVADDKGRGDMLKYVGDLLYRNNAERMEELLSLTAEDFKRGEAPVAEVKSIHDRLKEKMGSIGTLKVEKGEKVDAD